MNKVNHQYLADAEFRAFNLMFGEGSQVGLRHRVNSLRLSLSSHCISSRNHNFPAVTGFLCKSESKLGVSVHLE